MLLGSKMDVWRLRLPHFVTQYAQYVPRDGTSICIGCKTSVGPLLLARAGFQSGAPDKSMLYIYSFVLAICFWLKHSHQP